MYKREIRFFMLCVQVWFLIKKFNVYSIWKVEYLIMWNLFIYNIFLTYDFLNYASFIFFRFFKYYVYYISFMYFKITYVNNE